MNFIELCMIAGTILLIVVIVLQYVHRKKPALDVVQLREGTIGAGKTFLCVADLLSTYKKIDRRYRNRNNPIRIMFGLVSKVPPVVYSNIPLYLRTQRYHGKKKKAIKAMSVDDIAYKYRLSLPLAEKFKKTGKREIWAEVVTREQLLLEAVFPSNCVPLVLLDEVGMIACQYSYDDPNIVSTNLVDSAACFSAFARFFRHHNGEYSKDFCRLYLTDQCTSDLVKEVRVRLGFVDFLHGFHRFGKVLPFYKIGCRTLMQCEDNVENVNETVPTEDMSEEFFFGFLPYKFFSRKHYDSHAYFGTKFTGFVSRVGFTNWAQNDYMYFDENGICHIDPLKTNYCPDLRMTAEEKAFYDERLRKLRLDVRAKVALES